MLFPIDNRPRTHVEHIASGAVRRPVPCPECTDNGKVIAELTAKLEAERKGREAYQPLLDQLLEQGGEASVKAFIVFGQTGEYSDHTDWPVRGFLSREKAEAFEMECTKAAKAFKKYRDKRRENAGYAWDFEIEEAELKKAVAGDPSFRCEYTGTDYFTIEVEVEQ
jgi:hypothetical protein